MNIVFSSPDSYPVMKTVISEETVMEAPAAPEDYLRLRDLIAAKYGFTKEGYLNPVDDQFYKDILSLTNKYAQALTTLQGIAVGSFTSTDENPQYVRDVVSPGNRIYTPQEAANNVLDVIQGMK